MIYDTGSSIAQFYGLKTHVVSISDMPNAILSNHHMILLTYLMGGFVKFGEMLGSQNFGFFLYCFLQVVMTNAVFMYGVSFVRKNRIVFAILVLLYAFLPVISIWEFVMSKDALFSMFLTLLSIMLYRVVKSNGSVAECLRYRIGMYCVTGMCILTKQQGAYIIIGCALIMILCYKKADKMASVLLCMSVFYLTAFTGSILPALHVAPSSKQEMMGFMFQQTARYVVEHELEVTLEEKENIDSVLPYDLLTELYDPRSQDPVKFEYKQAADSQDRTDYIKTWFKMFWKHPESYIRATFDNCRGFFIPDEGDTYAYWPLSIEGSGILNEYSEVFSLYNTKLQRVYYSLTSAIEWLGRIPIINVFFKAWFYVWMTIIIVLLSLIKGRKRYGNVLYLIPVILSLCLLVITPVVEFRYTLPFVYLMPLLYGIYFERE